MRAALAGLALLVVSSTALAEVSAQDRALAEALFREGKDLAEKEKISEACLKFADSQRLDPKLGTLLYLATCHEQEGKTATAWIEFNEAAAQAARANQPDRERLARDRARALEKDLPNLTLKTSGSEPGLTIELDGRPFPASGLGTSVPIDPGTHKLVVRAPKKQAWTHEITAEKAATLTVQIPALPAEAAAEPTPTPTPTPVKPAAPEAPSDGSGKRTVGWVLVGVGGVGLVAGTIFGVRAASLESDAKAVCPDKACPTQEGLTLHDDASRNALISTIGFGVGVAAVGVGLFLVLTSPSKTLSLSPSLSPRSAGLDAHVHF